MPALASGTQRYRRREPETTLLYRVVAAELGPLEEELSAASPTGKGLPTYVKRELSGYLRCGLLCHGFARVVCKQCRTEHLVGFSCRGRGLCPSCTTRRMHDTAFHLVDRVLPRVPIRQWVVTFPRQVRYHLAAEPRLAQLALQEVLRTLFTWQRGRARQQGLRPSRANSSGAVSMVQRFNSALQLALHYHILCPDGVFVRDDPHPDACPRFAAQPAPSEGEVQRLLDTIIKRVNRMMDLQGPVLEPGVDHDQDRDHQPQLLFASAGPRPPGSTAALERCPPLCARRQGFSLHAGVAVHANDRPGLEKLCRYGLRPALSLERLSLAPDGHLVYAMKRTFSDGTSRVRFSPRELLLRLCALVPPAGFHMVRYAGIFSGHARGRHALTGRGMRDDLQGCARPRQPQAHVLLPSNGLLPDGLRLDLDLPDAPWRERRLPWATLLQRTFGIDVLVCPACQGPMRMIAFIQDERTARKILDHLGLPSRAPPCGPTWHPGQHRLPFEVESCHLDGSDNLPVE
jgi:hypothetical protein